MELGQEPDAVIYIVSITLTVFFALVIINSMLMAVCVMVYRWKRDRAINSMGNKINNMFG